MDQRSPGLLLPPGDVTSMVKRSPPNSHVLGQSLWERTAAPGPKLEPLAGARKADVAVIGAGLAGLSTALHLAEKGLAVTVIEADEVGSGATGKSGGLLAPDMISHCPSAIERLFGSERGSRLLRMVGSSASQCFELIEKYDLSCDAEQTGFWTPAHDAAVASTLQSRAHEWQARGFNVHYAEPGETAACLGTNRYLGAIRFDDGGTVDPLALSRGLAATARRFGAEIYGQSPVTSLNRHGSGWRVETDHGLVEAERVVLAANGGNPALHPALRHTILPLDVVEFATAPLSEAQRSSILRDRISFTDKRAYIFTARYDAAGRLVSAFPNFMVKRSGAALFAEAARRIEQFYPALKGLPIEYLWHGRAWINPALLPSVHDLGEGAFAIQACNGRGITTNVVLGKELAAALEQRDPACLSVVPAAPVPVRAHRLARYAPSALMLLAFLRSRLFRSAKAD